MKYATLIATLLLVDSAQAWWGKAHLFTARIAYDILMKDDPSLIEKVDKLLANLSNYNTKKDERNYPFVECANYADDFKYHGGFYQKEWHFIDQPYLQDGGTISDYPKFHPSSQHVVGAAVGLKNWMNDPSANDQYTEAVKKGTKGSADEQYSTGVRLLIHFTADCHCPVHAVSRVDKQYPSGDFGANAEKVPSKNGASNLHAVWDSVGYEYGGYSDLPYSESGWKEMGEQAEAIAAKHPVSSLPYDVTNLDPVQWGKESFDVASKYVYAGTEMNKALSSQYVTDAVFNAEQRIVAGGNRLANLIKSLKFAGPSYENENKEELLLLQ